jgi:hypothetical protein
MPTRSSQKAAVAASASLRVRHQAWKALESAIAALKRNGTLKRLAITHHIPVRSVK